MNLDKTLNKSIDREDQKDSDEYGEHIINYTIANHINSKNKEIKELKKKVEESKNSFENLQK